ncbi:hypothetical protein FMM05_04640 [Flavobacterium zepuense]|uniref:Uncharacterized protein n=1 Tax=Flavobacterium zepuense TaxID=2593302 RepID=A0A552V895_9FLAO|nr:hypothetical protein [Flavobacterium zepuense]TRW26670.1 hypothetical protein FMM05_04640 [Flavobacterium zepuense]
MQENGYTPENVAWIKQLINETIKTGLSFDIDKSFVSPFNIDMSAVSGTTPEEVKFNSIYNKVVTSPTFKQMFINVFGDNTKINAKFIIEEIPQTNNTTIYGLCQLQPYSSPNVLSNIIKIDKSHLLDTSDDVLAVAIIHECLHAFLNVKLRNPEIGMAILDINDMKFDECINTYYNGFTGNQNQHDFFVNHMTPTIKQILTEIKNTLYTPQQIYLTTHPELPNGVAIHSPMDNVIPLQPSEQVIPWNWDDYFTHLSFMGITVLLIF